MTLLLSVGLPWTPAFSSATLGREDPDDLLVVDCLLPGKIRRLGSMSTFLTARRPIKTSAEDCRIRGGEYTEYDRANYATALKVWLGLAKQGDPVAQTYVGEIYEKGLGVAPEYRLAAQWYRKAAEQGHARAQVDLGQLYEKGLGVPKDPAQSVAWYRKASGLAEAKLAYVPLTAGATQVAAERDRYPRRVQALKRELDAVKERQARIDQELAKRRKAGEQAAKQVAALREELARSRKANSGGTANRPRTRELEARLAAQQRELVRREREAKRLAEEAARYRQEYRQISRAQARVEKARADRARVGAARLTAAQQEIARLKKALAEARKAPVMESRSSPDAPAISVIDPPLQRTRSGGGLRATTNALGPRPLIGRVSDPDGILSLLINGKEYPLNAQNVFRAQVPIRTRVTPVEIVAVDNAGHRTQLHFRIDYREKGGARPLKGNGAALLVGKDYGIDFGDYYALVIGNDEYRSLPRLKTAVNDAKAVASVLENRFGFKVKLLLNADRYRILSALNELRAGLTDEDNLLIYYAGHGELDRINDRGHWLPVDAEKTSSANWISNVAITDILNASSARHILVVADSCYSGSLTRSAIASIEGAENDEMRRKWLEVMAGKRSRLVLSSGGVAPVLDSGGGQHSVFAKSFLGVLNKIQGVVDTQRIYLEVAAEVGAYASDIGMEQLPQFAPIKFAGHVAGDFFFVTRPAS